MYNGSVRTGTVEISTVTLSAQGASTYTFTFPSSLSNGLWTVSGSSSSWINSLTLSQSGTFDAINLTSVDAAPIINSNYIFDRTSRQDTIKTAWSYTPGSPDLGQMLMTSGSASHDANTKLVLQGYTGGTTFSCALNATPAGLQVTGNILPLVSSNLGTSGIPFSTVYSSSYVITSGASTVTLNTASNGLSLVGAGTFRLTPVSSGLIMTLGSNSFTLTPTFTGMALTSGSSTIIFAPTSTGVALTSGSSTITLIPTTTSLGIKSGANTVDFAPTSSGVNIVSGANSVGLIPTSTGLSINSGANTVTFAPISNGVSIVSGANSISFAPTSTGVSIISGANTASLAPTSTGLSVISGVNTVTFVPTTTGVSINSGANTVSLAPTSTGLSVISGANTVTFIPISNGVSINSGANTVSLAPTSTGLSIISGANTVSLAPTSTGVSIVSGSNTVSLAPTTTGLSIISGANSIGLTPTASGVSLTSSAATVTLNPANLGLDIVSGSNSVRLIPATGLTINSLTTTNTLALVANSNTGSLIYDGATISVDGSTNFAFAKASCYFGASNALFHEFGYVASVTNIGVFAAVAGQSRTQWKMIDNTPASKVGTLILNSPAANSFLVVTGCYIGAADATIGDTTAVSLGIGSSLNTILGVAANLNVRGTITSTSSASQNWSMLLDSGTTARTTGIRFSAGDTESVKYGALTVSSTITTSPAYEFKYSLKPEYVSVSYQTTLELGLNNGASSFPVQIQAYRQDSTVTALGQINNLGTWSVIALNALTGSGGTTGQRNAYYFAPANYAANTTGLYILPGVQALGLNFANEVSYQIGTGTASSTAISRHNFQGCLSINAPNTVAATECFSVRAYNSTTSKFTVGYAYGNNGITVTNGILAPNASGGANQWNGCTNVVDDGFGDAGIRGKFIVMSTPTTIGGTTNNYASASYPSFTVLRTQTIPGSGTYTPYTQTADYIFSVFANGNIQFGSSTNSANSTIYGNLNPGLADFYGLGTIGAEWKEARINFVYGTVLPPSDSRLKENVAPCRYGLDFIRQLQPKEYSYIGRPGLNMGFIAQDLQAILDPEFTTVVGEDTLHVRLFDLLGPIVRAIQELDSRNNLLSA